MGAVLGVVAGPAGAVDGNNIPDGTITRLKMATANRDCVDRVCIPLVATTLAVVTDVGFTQGVGQREFFGPIADVDMTLWRADYVADSVATNAVVFQPARAAVAVGVTDTLPVGATPAQVGRAFSGIAYTTGQRIGILVNGTGGTTNTRGGVGWLRFIRPLTAS